MNNDVTFLVDMDGVLCDFVGGVRDLYAFLYPEGEVKIPADADWEKGNYDMCKVAGITAKHMWSVIDQAEGFWETLVLLPHAQELFSELQGLGRTVICTSPSLHHNCVSGKLKWLQSIFGRNFRDYVFTTHKELLAKPNTILIDDHDRNCEKFVQHGGRAICYPQPWNSHYDVMKDYPELFKTKKQYVMQGVEICLGLEAPTGLAVEQKIDDAAL